MLPAPFQLRSQHCCNVERRAGARGCHPLELVEGEDELCFGAGGGPLLDHGEQGLPPAVDTQLREQRHVERTGGLFQKLPHLQRGRGLLPQVVDTGLVGHEPQDELALADPAPPVNRDELRSRRLERPRQYSEFRCASDESRHDRNVPRSRRFVKSRFVKSCLDKT